MDTENSNEPMQVIKLENEEMFDHIEGIIDLDELFLAQSGAASLDTGHYQYAILKDGKFHLQSENSSQNIMESQEIENSNCRFTLDQTELNNTERFLDLSLIKGRNLKTGQVINLPRCMEKDTNIKLKSFHSSRKYSNEKQKSINDHNLKRLINKKIPIGATDRGKKLVGKIVSVMKKADINIKENAIKKNSDKMETIAKKSVIVPSEKLKEVSNAFAEEVINLIDSNESSSERRINKTFKESTDDTNTRYQSNVIVDDVICEDSFKAKSIIPKSFSIEQVKAKDKNIEIDKHDLPIQDCEYLPENSKIIVQNKVVSKDCFDDITKTMTGLMNMDSVVKKLRNRTIIIKIIEKIYDQDKKDYKKTISYCSGYMVREYKLDDRDGSFSEAWKFIPDTNSKDTILGQNKLEFLLQDGFLGSNSLRKFANLTIQINVNQEGCRTTKVIINPPALFQCKVCFKTFRKSALLKAHSADTHVPVGPECTKTEIESAEAYLLLRSLNENKKGMYECAECNQSFQTSTQIKKHMQKHYTPKICLLCKKRFSNVTELTKHMLTHSNSKTNDEFSEQKNTNDKVVPRKVYGCHKCSRQFSRHSNLQRHLDIHKGEGAMYQCAICSCSYHYISSLTRHVVSCHVEKSKNKSNVQTGFQPMSDMELNQQVQFFQDDQMVQMIPLENFTEEGLQQYVNENMTYVTEHFEATGDALNILQIPVDSSIIIED